MKKVLLEISQNLQAAPATLLKKRLWHRYFPVNFEKFLRTPFFTEHLWWLLLTVKILGCITTNFHNDYNFHSLSAFVKIYL